MDTGLDDSPTLRLAALSEASRSGLVAVAQAANAWRVGRTEAAVRLSRLATAGWIARVRRGLYYILPLDAASGNVTTFPDAWVLGSRVFAPCYIGGWSAAEHWSLTEQIFRNTFLATAAEVRARKQILMGLEFHLAKVSPDRVRGIETVWRGSERVAVSSAERTIVDGLLDPTWLGGVRHLTDCLRTFLEERRGKGITALLAELDRSGAGAAAKRLGYLLEALPGDHAAVTERLAANLTKGLIKLDPSLHRKGRISTRWGLIVNVSVE